MGATNDLPDWTSTSQSPSQILFQEAFVGAAELVVDKIPPWTASLIISEGAVAPSETWTPHGVTVQGATSYGIYQAQKCLSPRRPYMVVPWCPQVDQSALVAVAPLGTGEEIHPVYTVAASPTIPAEYKPPTLVSQASGSNNTGTPAGLVLVNVLNTFDSFELLSVALTTEFSGQGKGYCNIGCQTANATSLLVGQRSDTAGLVSTVMDLASVQTNVGYTVNLDMEAWVLEAMACINYRQVS